MDIFRFINSTDIRNYLKEIKYEFSPLEAAWLIYRCKNLSYVQKKKAWSELISAMPDIRTPKRMNCEGYESLHELLKKYMEIVEKELADFENDDTSEMYAYMYSYLYKGDHEWTGQYETVYSSYEKCINAYKKDVADLDETYHPGETGVIKYRVRKQLPDNPKCVYELEFDSNGDLLEILSYSDRTDEECEILDVFEGWWFDFPVPFRKGDIVWVPCEDHMIRWHCDGPFVLKGVSTWDASDHIRMSGDNSDMNGYGYFVNENGTVYYEVMHNYMDLEYYSGPFKMNEKILPALSKFIKGEIEIDLLLCAHRKIMFDIASDDVMLNNCYLKDDLTEIGLL